MLSRIVLVILAILLIGAPAHADGAFKWKDENGRWAYGSKPPAGAKEVVNLSGIGISRYSSKTVLRQGTRSEAENALIVENAGLPKPAQLEQGRLHVTEPTKATVTACKVTVRNTGDEKAEKVLVSFEFEDGTMVPAMGPDTIAGLSEAVYFISPDQLPINVSGVKERDKMKQPRVLIQFSP